MQPVIIEDAITIAGSTTNDNVIVSNASLRKYLRAPFQARGKLVVIASLASMRVQLDYGSKNVVDLSDVRVGTDLQEPLDVLNDNWYPSEGDQLVLRAVNANAGANILRYRIVLYPMFDQAGNPMQLPPDTRVVQRLQSIAANAIDTQVLDGLRYERPPVDSMLSVWLTASAIGLTRKLSVGTEEMAPPSAIPPLNRIPQDPFDLSLEDIESPQDRQVELAISNSTGGALTLNFRAAWDEMYRT